MSETIQPPHLSVLYREILEALAPHPNGRYIDGTVGAGGHAWGILEQSAPNGQLLGLDLDPQALVIANQRLSVFSERVFLHLASYSSMTEQAAELQWTQVDGIVLDLGVSSMQLDTPERGFSFRHDGPLDMRFGEINPKSANTIINQYSEAEIAEIIWVYGEDRLSRKIAQAICRQRPLHSTQELASLIEKVYGNRPTHPHPATRTFQAIRIAVNEELQTIEQSIPKAIKLLAPSGRLAVISFHSLEDRIVKQIFRKESRDCLCPPEQPMCTCGHKATIKEINRKPLEATPNEIAYNPRARSAKLRIAEKTNLA